MSISDPADQGKQTSPDLAELLCATEEERAEMERIAGDPAVDRVSRPRKAPPGNVKATKPSAKPQKAAANGSASREQPKPDSEPGRERGKPVQELPDESD